MTKRKPKPERAVDAVRQAIDHEAKKRSQGLKPIEIVKTALCAYMSYTNTKAGDTDMRIESVDRLGLRRGTQAAVDRLLFNANYWLAAYEDRIVQACDPVIAESLLKAVTVWGSHTLKLNTLGSDEVVATFERFCPPFAANKRRGSQKGRGKGPVAEFEERVDAVLKTHPEYAKTLGCIAADMRAEANAYAALPSASALDALYAILPAWCLRDEVCLVSGGWWEDADVMRLLADELRERFVELGYGDAPCRYYHDSMLEAVDAYARDVSSVTSPYAAMPVPELLQIVHAAREAHHDFEVSGYGKMLPAWLIAKEQLIWNTVVCAVYGPGAARPLLGPAPSSTVGKDASGSSARSDVITDLAKSSFDRYRADRAQTGDDRGYKSFSDQPLDLKNSSIEHIKSIPGKLEILGYEIVPDGSCYPSQRVESFSPSEIECLAVLEHRRWINERVKAGWVYGEKRDVEAKTSPYLLPWEELPDRAREWNRSAIRNIPALLRSENLAIARK